jgi:hypothetical protein
LTSRAAEHAGSHHLFHVLRPELLGDRAGEIALVVVLLLKADREGPDGVCALTGHRGDDASGVQAAAQEGAERYIAAHADAHGVPEELREALLDLVGVAEELSLVAGR